MMARQDSNLCGRILKCYAWVFRCKDGTNHPKQSDMDCNFICRGDKLKHCTLTDPSLM